MAEKTEWHVFDERVTRKLGAVVGTFTLHHTPEVGGLHERDRQELVGIAYPVRRSLFALAVNSGTDSELVLALSSDELPITVPVDGLDVIGTLMETDREMIVRHLGAFGYDSHTFQFPAHFGEFVPLSDEATEA